MLSQNIRLIRTNLTEIIWPHSVAKTQPYRGVNPVIPYVCVYSTQLQGCPPYPTFHRSISQQTLALYGSGFHQPQVCTHTFHISDFHQPRNASAP